MTGRNEDVAIVTGGASGIGLAIACRLAAEGGKVAVFGRSDARVEAAVRRLAGIAAPDRILGQAVDIREPDQVLAFIQRVEERLGAVSILVNNAAVSPKAEGRRIALAATRLDDWNDVLSVNLTGAFLCTRALLPGMAARRYGRIVMIGSIAARARPRFAGAAYVAAKAGLAGLARAVAAEYAADGITANTVSPGNVATEMTGGPGSAQNRAAVSEIPAGRIGEPGDIAGIVAFLCSPDGGFINGATIDVTGAEYLAP